MLNVDRVTRGATAAMVAAVSGGIALLAILLFLPLGQPFGTVSDLAIGVMIVALAPMMLAHYELGGIVPLWPARLSLGGAVLAVAGWAALELAFLGGLIAVDTTGSATGLWAVQWLLQAVIGLWIAGASLLAGPWLPLPVRTLGIVAGMGTVLMAAGMVRGGFNDPLTELGGLGFQILVPVWALLLGRVFRRRAADAGPMDVAEAADTEPATAGTAT